MSVEDQQKIKVAFAEGYMAGQTNKKPSKTIKWLKVVQDVLTIMLFLGIFVSLMGKYLLKTVNECRWICIYNVLPLWYCKRSGKTFVSFYNS